MREWERESESKGVGEGVGERASRRVRAWESERVGEGGRVRE